MKLLAFAASNSHHSINRALVSYALTRLKDFSPLAHTEFLNLNDFEMPIYSIDREKEAGIPMPAHDFFKHIGAADALLVSYAEHNGGVTAAWKNIFDWMSRIEMKLWQGKPLVMLAATPGSRAGANVLKTQAMLAPHFGADLQGQFGIGDWSNNWNPDQKQLVHDSDIKELDELLARLVHPS